MEKDHHDLSEVRHKSPVDGLGVVLSGVPHIRERRRYQVHNGNTWKAISIAINFHHQKSQVTNRWSAVYKALPHKLNHQ